MLRAQCTANRKSFTQKTQSTFGNKGEPEVWIGIWVVYIAGIFIAFILLMKKLLSVVLIYDTLALVALFIKYEIKLRNIFTNGFVILKKG